MDFTKMLFEHDRLTRGDARITIDPKLSLAQFAECVNDQSQDLAEVLSEMSEEDLLDLTEALDHAVTGMVELAEHFKPLHEISMILRESEDMEQAKIYPIAQRTRGALADIGKIVKTLKVAAAKAHEASWRS